MTPRFLLLPTSAIAAKAEHVDWTGYGWSDCTNRTSTGWTCYYNAYSSDCVEAAFLGSTLARCEVEMHATVRVVPLFNAAGRVVGCTSVSLSPSTSGYAAFDSTFAEFDLERGRRDGGCLRRLTRERGGWSRPLWLPVSPGAGPPSRRLRLRRAGSCSCRRRSSATGRSCACTARTPPRNGSSRSAATAGNPGGRRR